MKNMLRLLRFRLPVLWMIAMLVGVHGVISTTLLVGTVVTWLAPLLRPSGAAHVSAATRPDADPLQSSFDTVPTPDPAWTRFTVHPAKGKGPTTSLMTVFAIVGGGFGGGIIAAWFGKGGEIPVFVVAAPILAYALNWAIHTYVLGAMHRSGYRNAIQAPNQFDVGPAALRVSGEVIPRSALLKYAISNPFSNAAHHVPISSTLVVGISTLGAVAAVGSASGSSVARAASIQRAHLLHQLATHGWILEVIDTRGNAHRLAGGLTEHTLDALVRAIETHLGA